jgi:predicted  nucleic acid-binding Zn-ribbon protein
VKIQEELRGFVTLQRLLDQRTLLRRERDTPPAELAALRAAFAARSSRLAELDHCREALQGEQATLQREAEALREERDHFRKQRSQVTNMKQLQAVVSELDFVEAQIKGKEDRLLEIWQEIEAIGKEVEALQQETPEEKERRTEAERLWTEQRKVSAAELVKVDDELRMTQRTLGSQAMVRFKKLWTSRKPNAVVPLDGTSCSSCHAELRPSLVQQIRAMEELGFCDTCRRLLYEPEKL